MENHQDLAEENQELYEHYRIKADKGQRPLRIDKFLMHRIENASRNKIQHAAKAGSILVNGNPVKQNYKVKPGDDISILLTYPPREIEIIPQNIPIDIVYEDQYLLIVNKPAGMVVHPAYANYTGTLVNALSYYLPANHDDQPQIHLVHRIDKDTSGLLLISKNEEAQSILANQFFHHSIERKYVALVWGDFDEDQGTIEGNIGRDPKNRKVMTVFSPDDERGKNAITHYRVIERFDYVTMVECQLETGRTHQIRAHMKSMGHPIFNDGAYGGDRILKGTTFTKYRQFVDNCFKALPRQALHAKSLGFIHPGTGKSIHFESEIPADMQQVIDKWRKYTSGRLSVS